MKYMLLMYSDESKVPQTEQEIQAIAPEKWYALLQEMKAAGVLIGQKGVLPTANATTVRVRDGKTLTTDGPFAETHEQFGGYFMLDCKDLDEAIGWAQKIPHAMLGSVEIRPLWSPE